MKMDRFSEYRDTDLDTPDFERQAEIDEARADSRRDDELFNDNTTNQKETK